MSHQLSSSHRAVLSLILAAASWGVGTVISKRAVEEVPPLTLLPIQLTASLIVLALLIRWRRLPLRDPSAAPVLGRLGLLNPGLSYALALLGLAQITASLSVLLWAVEPILILLLAAIALRERVAPRIVALSLVAVAGMVLVLHEPGTAGTLVGVGLTLAGIACCAVYTVVARACVGTAEATGSVVATQQAYALAFALVLVSVVWALGGAVVPGEVSAAAWLSAGLSGVLYYGIAYWFYLSALRRLPASTAAASFYLIPVFGVAGGVVGLGERLASVQWVGMAIVLGAVFAILRHTPTVPRGVRRPKPG